MARTYRIYPNVKIGSGVRIGDYCILGVPPLGHAKGELALIIGEGSTIRSHTVIYAGTAIGRGLETGHGVVIREFVTLGDEVRVGHNSVIQPHACIGHGVRILHQVSVGEYTVIEDECFLAPKVALAHGLDRDFVDRGRIRRGPIIKRRAIVGASSVVGPGVTVGERCFIGAASVVLEDAPAHKVLVGNPARVVKSVYDFSCPYGLIDRPYTEGESLVLAPENEATRL